MVGCSGLLVSSDVDGLQLLNGPATTTVPDAGSKRPLAIDTARSTRNVTAIPVPGSLVRLLKYTTGRVCGLVPSVKVRLPFGPPGPTLPSHTSTPAWLITNLFS